ncbi:MAG: hypothetical protein K0041_02555 [Acidithiobacillus sp.]|nr:hypothetical protein [Acidithiobacillus sp.]
MQDLMLLLEIAVAILISVELFLRFRARRQRGKSDQKNTATTPGVAPSAAPSPVQPESPSPVSTAAAPTVEPMELSGDDLLQEAGIYMQYGHYSQAATVLRWYVDLQPNDTRAVNQLLDAYLALEDFSAYAQLLESLGESLIAAKDQGWWKERVSLGLRRDPGNLELLVLAEKLGLPIPTPESQLDEPMTAAKALALVSRNADPQYGIAILHAAILEEPLRLPLYAELLRITHQQHDLEGYLNGLILMDLALGHGGSSIQERMLRAGKNLGPHPMWARLESAQGNPSALRALAAERNLTLSPRLPVL